MVVTRLTLSVREVVGDLHPLAVMSPIMPTAWTKTVSSSKGTLQFDCKCSIWALSPTSASMAEARR